MAADGQFLTFPQAFNLAAEHYKAGRANEAAELCEKIVAGAPNYADAVHLKAVLLMDKGELASAESMARRATELAPDNASYINTVGVILKKQKRFDDAVVAFDRVVELDPNFIPVHTNIGLILQMQGKYAEAEKAHRRSVDLDPSYVTALHNLANLLMDAGRLEESAEFFRRALESRPADPEIHTHRALCQLMSGDFERGWDEYEWRMQMQSQLTKALATSSSARVISPRPSSAAALWWWPAPRRSAGSCNRLKASTRSSPPMRRFRRITSSARSWRCRACSRPAPAISPLSCPI